MRCRVDGKHTEGQNTKAFITAKVMASRSANHLPVADVESSKTAVRTSALGRWLGFTRRRWLAVLGTSIAVLIPCFWHEQIAAGDLGSHLYNAWLAQLVERGQLPGVCIARQWNNVLFDFMLSGLGELFSLRIAERISVSACVLVFFWGSFALIAAATERAPWTLLPLIAMISYGWTFHVGFFNYYLSLALAFCALAVFWRGKTWERILAIALAPLIMLAQPFGVALLIGGAAYIWLVESMPPKYHALLLALSLVILGIAHSYIWHHWPSARTPTALIFYNGTDQLAVFGKSYRWVMAALLSFGGLSIAADGLKGRSLAELWQDVRLPLQLFLAVEMAVFLLPNYIHLPQYEAPLFAVTPRLTSISAILGCCLLGAIRPRKWHFVGYSVIALVFLALLYRDTATVNRMEEKAERLVGTLPPGSVVVSTAWHPPGSRLLVEHIVDRACIGHCFSYANYEPASRQFRVRASPGNPFVTARLHYNSEEELRSGNYKIDLPSVPAYEIYGCGEQRRDLCMRSLPGETR